MQLKNRVSKNENKKMAIIIFLFILIIFGIGGFCFHSINTMAGFKVALNKSQTNTSKKSSNLIARSSSSMNSSSSRNSSVTSSAPNVSSKQEIKNSNASGQNKMANLIELHAKNNSTSNTTSITPEKDNVEKEDKRSSTNGNKPALITKMPVSIDNVKLMKDDTVQLNVALSSGQAPDKALIWESLNPDIATVEDGNITGIQPGQTTIVAKSIDENYQSTCSISVVESAKEPANISTPHKSHHTKSDHSNTKSDNDNSSSSDIAEISLSKSKLNLNKGDSYELSISNQISSAIWFSSNTTVATVDNTGNVTAVSGGEATITAVVKGKLASCDVTVSVPATDISLNLDNVPIEKGDTLSLIAQLEPKDSTEKVKWKTSDRKIVSVDDKGQITGKAPGTATITATAANGDVSATCQVTTVISVSSIKLSDEVLKLSKGDDYTLVARILPEDATEDTQISWSSSDESVATVNEDGSVEAVGGGSTIITAQTTTQSVQCLVTVRVPVSDISFDKDTVSMIKGTTQILKPIYSPEDATDKSIAWTSSDETVATVDNDGKVTAVSKGNATITATTKDKRCKAECVVSVYVPVTEIKLDKSKLDLSIGSTETLTANIMPEEATNKKVLWTSSNEDVATVDNDGKVTAIGEGSAVITASSDDVVTISDTCEVSVTIASTDESLFTIRDNGDGTCAIIGFSADANISDVVVPSHIQDKKVTSIESHVVQRWNMDVDVGIFYENGFVKTVTLPDTVTKIGKSGFSDSTSLETVKIPNSVVLIEKYAFDDSGLTSISIPSSITSISEYAFGNCRSLASVELPKTLISIGGSAFEWCPLLSSIDIPNSLNSIGDSAFVDCESLTSLTIPSAVTKVGELAFAGSGLETVTFSPTQTVSIGHQAFSQCSHLKSVILPKNGNVKISGLAFEGCTKITSMDIPSSVTFLASRVFYDWTSQQTIYVYGNKYKDWYGDWSDKSNAKIVYLT